MRISATQSTRGSWPRGFEMKRFFSSSPTQSRSDRSNRFSRQPGQDSKGGGGKEEARPAAPPVASAELPERARSQSKPRRRRNSTSTTRKARRSLPPETRFGGGGVPTIYDLVRSAFALAATPELMGDVSSIEGGSKWSGAALGPDGRILCSPFNAVSTTMRDAPQSLVLMIDSTSQTTETVDCSLVGLEQWTGA